jgi:hypothetical protein
MVMYVVGIAIVIIKTLGLANKGIPVGIRLLYTGDLLSADPSAIDPLAVGYIS